MQNSANDRHLVVVTANDLLGCLEPEGSSYWLDDFWGCTKKCLWYACGIAITEKALDRRMGEGGFSVDVSSLLNLIRSPDFSKKFAAAHKKITKNISADYPNYYDHSQHSSSLYYMKNMIKELISRETGSAGNFIFNGWLGNLAQRYRLNNREFRRFLGNVKAHENMDVAVICYDHLQKIPMEMILMAHGLEYDVAVVENMVIGNAKPFALRALTYQYNTDDHVTFVFGERTSTSSVVELIGQCPTSASIYIDARRIIKMPLVKETVSSWNAAAKRAIAHAPAPKSPSRRAAPRAAVRARAG